MPAIDWHKNSESMKYIHQTLSLYEFADVESLLYIFKN